MQDKKQLSKDIKIAVILLASFLVVLLMYAVNGYYLNRNGILETDFILNYTETEKLTVNGFAVRNEKKIIDGKNSCLISKNDDLIYVPVIYDSDNVSKNGTIALAFKTKQEADAYVKEQELSKRLDSIKELERSEELSHSNVLFLNSQLNHNVSDYIVDICSNSVSDIDTYIASITKNITSKQIAIGGVLDYDVIISDYTKQIRELKSSYKIVDVISSPHAGYFLSSTDGYEETYDFYAAENKNVVEGQGSDLLSASAKQYDNIYGKIILQHTWYYIFDVSRSDASAFKTGYWVKVSFDDLGIKNLDMQVYDISDLKDGMYTVTLRCTSMNDEILKIRKESAKISIKEYNGFKISDKALTQNENGVQGVYAVVGNVMKFSPIDVVFYGDGYVIAKGKKVAVDENAEKIQYYHVLRQYDKIIVKGLNLKDGSIVS